MKNSTAIGHCQDNCPHRHLWLSPRHGSKGGVGRSKRKPSIESGKDLLNLTLTHRYKWHLNPWRRSLWRRTRPRLRTSWTPPSLKMISNEFWLVYLESSSFCLLSIFETSDLNKFIKYSWISTTNDLSPPSEIYKALIDVFLIDVHNQMSTHCWWQGRNWAPFWRAKPRQFDDCKNGQGILWKKPFRLQIWPALNALELHWWKVHFKIETFERLTGGLQGLYICLFDNVIPY